MTAPAPRPARTRLARRRVPSLALASLLLAAAGWACRPADTTRPRAHRGARISIALPSLDAPTAPLVYALTRARLVTMDQTGVVRPALIERWTPSDAQRTWTLIVRDGVRLNDGRLLGAADVVGMLREEVADPDSSPGFWPVTGIDQAGPREVRLTLSEPTSLLLETLSIVQAEAGAYKVVDPTAREPELESVAQPGESGAIGSIKVRQFETPRAAVAALLRGDVDVLYDVPPEERNLLATEDGVNVVPHVKPYVVTLGLNNRHAALARREVRLALNAAVDREALIKEVADGAGVPAADIIWHQHWTRPHADDAALLASDRARAGRLLDEAGFPRRRNAAGVVQPRFRVSCLALDHPMMLRVAGRLQQTYADIGVALDVRAVALPELVDRLERGDFESFVSPMVTGYGLGMPYVYFGRHDRPRNIDQGYTAAAAAAERVRAATSDEALADAVGELHRVLIDDPPSVSLFWQESSRAVGRRVVVPTGYSGDVLASLSRWTIRSSGP